MKAAMRASHGYGYQVDADGLCVLLRDGIEVLRGREQDAWRHLHRSHSYSVDHALRFEGYAIVPASSRDDEAHFDMTALDAGEPMSIAAFLKVNDECPPDPSELAELRACPVGGAVNLGIGGGFVTVRRVR